MNDKKRRRKMVGNIIGISILIIVCMGVLFMALNPEFGGNASPTQIERFKKSKNYWDGKFHNLEDRHFRMSFEKMSSIREEYKNSSPNAEPKNNIPVNKISAESIQNLKHGTQIVWFGHSSVFVHTEGTTLLLDPMFSERPSPISGFGAKRFSNQLPIEVDQLPSVDAVVISHDHYDHLDYQTIRALRKKVNHFFTPLGVGAHLVRWGIEKDRITELDWNEEANIGSVRLVCTPAQHYSSRGKWLSDKAQYLWSSWVIESKDAKLYFSGDSGYGKHFKDIGSQYGPFDFAMMECGQYNPNWPENHMTPEESAQASADLQTAYVMPIHWGAFTLAMHDWLDPIRRINSAADKLNLNVVSPPIGTIVSIERLEEVSNDWWKTFDEESAQTK